MNDALHNKVVKWFYDHEELLIAIMNKTPYQSDGWDYEIEVVKEFLTQTEQESVTLKMDVIVVNLVREGINKHRARELAEHFIKHTTPPQRTAAEGEDTRRAWVGLTDEEFELLNDCGDTDSYKFARAIEAKLKEKNI